MDKLLFVLICILLKLNLNSNSSYIINMANIQKITKIISIPRPVSSINLAFVKKKVLNYISKINGFIAEEQEFTRVINNNSYSFSNIVAHNKNANSTNRQKIILTAHIDSLYNNQHFNGSIDSATSIALIIEITNKLKNSCSRYHN